MKLQLHVRFHLSVGKLKNKIQSGEPVSLVKRQNCRDNRKTAPRQDRMPKKSVLANCKRSKKEITMTMSDAEAQTSSRTVCICLSESGVKAR